MAIPKRWDILHSGKAPTGIQDTDAIIRDAPGYKGWLATLHVHPKNILYHTFAAYDAAEWHLAETGIPHAITMQMARSLKTHRHPA